MYVRVRACMCVCMCVYYGCVYVYVVACLKSSFLFIHELRDARCAASKADGAARNTRRRRGNFSSAAAEILTLSPEVDAAGMDRSNRDSRHTPGGHARSMENF